ncbi:collagen binding domain-containing protein [Actinoplanes sp. N902-109]|uniref:MSCRAMM family protein n=1 Tax=Actinoplanes sp. (strain N902-109) TaxID=649831 RepID=UPI00032956DA|nr:carboxypeptidase-like regulatory domain-containing protein [Actinoplanes sp. N902-109]AGL16925.1 Cna B domain-containing protein [Actinoplanes sp. N902-109]
MKRLRIIVSVVSAVVLAGTAAMTAGASPASAQTRTGSLTGVVRDTRGTPVGGATIVVYPADLSGAEAGRTTTGARGEFTVPALQPGSYQILIDRDGWSEWAPGQRTDPATATAYRVRAGHTTVAPSVVTAPGLIAGRVTTAQGRPAAGIAVAVLDRTTAAQWDTTTVANGSYAISLPPGSAYLVTFTNGYLTQYSPRTLAWDQARVYTVTAGRATRIDERLLAPAMLTGRLTDQSGRPVADARVSVSILATASSAETTTAADGTYRLATMPPGDVVVGFQAPDGRRQWAYGKRAGSQANRISLALGTVTTVDDTLLPAIPPGSLAGVVTTATGEPAAGIAVAVHDPAAGQWDTVTAADGSWSVTLPPGTGYYLSFTNGELTQYAPRTLDPAQAVRYEVSAGAVTRVDEQLLAPAVLTGRLTEATGTPVGGAQVAVDLLATAGVAETTTAPDGTYRLGAMPAGAVVIGFVTPDGRHQWVHGRTDYRNADRIILELGTVTTVDETLLPLLTAAR